MESLTTSPVMQQGFPFIKGLKRISKPGRRVYSSVEDMPRVLSGLGIAIVSTSKGVITDKVARAEKVGGEVLAYLPLKSKLFFQV